jgi:hypothetical protein
VAALALPVSLFALAAGCGGSKAPAQNAVAQPAQAPAPASATPSTTAPATPPAGETPASAAPATGNNALVGPGNTSHPTDAFSFDMVPPTDSKEHYVAWMVEHRNEDSKFLGERWDRYDAA